MGIGTVWNRHPTACVLLALTLVVGRPMVDTAFMASAAETVSLCGAPLAATPVSTNASNHMPTDSAPYDLRFIDEMIALHAGAIAMANVALQQAQDSDVRRMALRIAESRTGEIQLLRYWRETWYPGAEQTNLPSQSPDGNESNETNDGSAIAKLCAAGTDFDRLFFESMVSHHGAAIAIADKAIANAEHAEIMAYAESVIEAQGNEVAMMTRWLEDTNSIPAASD